MKKRLYLLLAICCLSLLSFTACTTDNDGIRNDNTTETTVNGPTTGTTTDTTIAPTTATTTTTTPTTR